MTKPRSFWPSAGTGRIGSNSYKPASGPHCLLCFVVRGPALHWLECPSGGYRALDLDLACGDYEGPATLAAKKAEMEKDARKEVLRFKDQCKIAGDTGKEILQKLLDNRQAGKGADELCTAAFPKDVTMWIREKGCHPVIWHTKDREYQFASELHAKVASEILKSTSQSTP